MKILLTNDDGILAPGIAAMYRELTTLGEVHVAAPETGQSAVAHAITVLRPIPVRKIHVHGEFHGFAVEGRPADCVKLALTELIGGRPDLIVSGINDGSNLSINVLYSGTVAAAADGAFFGVPSFAVSLEHGEELDFSRAARIALRLISEFLQRGLSGGQLININIPNLAKGPPKDVRVAPQALQTMEDKYVKFQGPDGRMYYWLDGDFGQIDDPDSDLHLLNEGYVVVTPLHFNMTHYQRIGELAAWSWPEVSGF
ncbi:MAG: 5'-nucleotidase SurE [Phycisphaerae bacterium]|nr:5'-nucleotidase SurE [Phycisphaerae bacterium]